MTEGGEQKQLGEATASAAHMTSINYALNVVHFSCVIKQRTWILDNGASEHMSLEHAFLYDLSLLNCPVLVNLPNGTQVRAIHKGKLRITKELVLNDVLLVSKLCSILSIERLCEQLHNTVNFIQN